jgi:hypothetical protein
MTRKFTFHTAAGTVCCANDDPDPMLFCDDCKKKLAAATGHSRHAAGSHSNHHGTLLRTTAGNPYAAALSSRANERHDVVNDPTYWVGGPDGRETYSPTGEPPNGYLIHLAMRVLDAEDAAPTKAKR